MYYQDFAPYSYDLPLAIKGGECIGWLEASHKFPCRKAEESLLDKIKKVIMRECVNVMRGTHSCDFCSEERIWLEGKRELLGHAEIWIPGASREVTFSAPTLIYHYCRNHDYAPPQEFIDAGMAFDLASEWSGQAERERRVRAAFD